MNYIREYYTELVNLLYDMAPWLLLGFLIAGILHVFFPEGRIKKLLGKSNSRSVINAALLGVPLPLCSCGVIPTGVSFYRSGASKGSAISFLISTPQTGVDSILVTYSMLGLPLAILRPVVALFTGLSGGFLTNRLERNRTDKGISSGSSSRSRKNPEEGIISRVLGYAFGTFLMDIAGWILIGLLAAALIAVIIPDDFFASYIKNDFLGMLLILVASIPVYVCATSSIPIAAVLIMKGISPGAALVFLMAGPATNAATITVIGKTMGRRTLVIYLLTIMAAALISGFLIDYVFPAAWFAGTVSGAHIGYEHGLLPVWLKISSGILLMALIVFGYLRKYARRFIVLKKLENHIINESSVMSELKIVVKGMNCSHCKMNIENSLRSVDGISGSTANIDTGEVIIKGENLDIEQIKQAVEGIGYSFAGVKD